MNSRDGQLSIKNVSRKTETPPVNVIKDANGIEEINQLANNMKINEDRTNSVISNLKSLNMELEAVRQLHQDFKELNDLASASSSQNRSKLVADIHEEAKQLNAARLENQELRSMVQEQREMIEFIKLKFSTQIELLSKLQQAIGEGTESTTIVGKEELNATKQMKMVMVKAADLDDQAMRKEQEVIQKLEAENKYLRGILELEYIEWATPGKVQKS